MYRWTGESIESSVLKDLSQGKNLFYNETNCYTALSSMPLYLKAWVFIDLLKAYDVVIVDKS